jgi:cell division protein FtsI/penicillin-binding protein 2
MSATRRQIAASSRTSTGSAAFALAVAIGVTTLTSRMFYLQVVQGQGTDQGSDHHPGDRQRVHPVDSGPDLRRRRRPLVKNVVDYSVTVTPSDLPLDQELTVVAAAGLDSQPRSHLHRDSDRQHNRILCTNRSRSPTAYLDQVARFIQENADLLPGVKVVVTSKRQYLTKQLFAEIIGYEGQITAGDNTIN